MTGLTAMITVHSERGYTRGCRCTTCRTAASAAQARRRRLRAYGRSPMVDAAPVRDHVAVLRAAGIGVHRIADLAGTSHQVVTKLLYGDPSREQPPTRRMRRSSAVAILAVRPDRENVAARRLVDGTGTRRRLQALVCLGWSYKRLADELGVKPDTVGVVMAAERATAAMARSVAALYDRLWESPAPTTTRWERASVSSSLARAVRNGWVPPLAWDDDTIDDPAAVPQHDVTGAVPPGRRIHFEDVEWLMAAGNSIELIAARLGAKPSTIERYAGVIAAGAQDTWRHLADEHAAGAA